MRRCGSCAMTRLALEHAPAAAVPLRFLGSVPGWGLVAGLLLLWQGGALLQSRWAPGTVALVHVWTLGVLGNAMLGSLWQFLPVVAGARLPDARVGLRLHALFNLGLAIFVACLLGGWTRGVIVASGMLAATLLILAACMLLGLLRAGFDAALRRALAAPLLALAITAGLGLLLALGTAGEVALPLPRLTDLHAALGLLAWILGLTVAVGSVVMPMFQGAPPLPPWLVAQLPWALLGLSLLTGLLWLGGLAGWPLRGLGVAAGVGMGLGLVWLQRRARHVRNLPLRRGWTAAALALAGGGLWLALPGDGLTVGALVLGLGLPLLVVAMLLEIRSFLAWLGLQRRCGRGVHLPGIHRLLPDRDKHLALGLQLAAGLLLVLATRWPELARLAGLFLCLAHLALLLVFGRMRRRIEAFALRREVPA